MATDTTDSAYQDALRFLQSLFPDTNQLAIVFVLNRHGTADIENVVDELLEQASEVSSTRSDDPQINRPKSSSSLSKSSILIKKEAGFDIDVLRQMCEAFSDLSQNDVLDTLENANWDADAAVEKLLSLQHRDETGPETDAVTVILPPKHLRDGARSRTNMNAKQQTNTKLDIPPDTLVCIQEMFPQIDPDAVVDVLKTHGGDLDQTIDALAKWTDGSAIGRHARDVAVDKLKEFFQDVPVHRLVAVLQESKGDLDLAAAKLMGMDDDREENGPWKPVRSSTTSSLIPTETATKEIVSDAQTWNIVARKTSQNGMMRSTSEPLTRNSGSSSIDVAYNHSAFFAIAEMAGLLPDGMSAATVHASRVSDLVARADSLRSAAQQYHDMRGESFRRAARAFSRGGLTGYGAAGFYGSQGRELGLRMHARNTTAARMRLLANSLEQHSGAGNVLDLHGLSVAEAESMAVSYVEAWAQSTVSVGGRRLKVIVGAGRHSAGGVARLDGAVRRALQMRGWTADRGGVGWLEVHRRRSTVQE